ncbi:heme-binding protein [Dongia sp.]|uniref:GlcG/HbpS family heme-binding protein n=1 Tax=Dongia sp. TaxID=1977262 RepID=UPI0035B20CF4
MDKVNQQRVAGEAKRRRRLISLLAGAIAMQGLASMPAAAQVQTSGHFLSLDLAMEAAAEAARACAAKGWPVSVSVVDAAGNVKLQAKGDHSTIHTKDSSFRKAYTLVTFGPLFGFDRLGIWVEKLKSNPYAASYASLPNIFLLPGAVAVKIDGEMVAAIGVGGAPGGEKDEACAEAGLEKIKDRL